MHELPVIESICAAVSQIAEKYPGRRVTKINIVVGDLSSIIDDSLEYYFDNIRKDPLLTKAGLHITRTPAIAICGACHSKIAVSLPLNDACTKCGSKNIRINGGLEFYLDSIEFDHDIKREAGHSERKRQNRGEKQIAAGSARYNRN
jgi:hydrogenase nickel incorporation protein HypA/HybF